MRNCTGGVDGCLHSAHTGVDVERLVELGIQRQVPLAEVLHCFAAGADLELDQAQVGVVGVEGVGLDVLAVEGDRIKEITSFICRSLTLSLT